MSKRETVWIVCEVIRRKKNRDILIKGIGGVYEDKKDAIALAMKLDTQELDHGICIGPLEMNAETPDGPGTEFYYPAREEKPPNE